MKQHKHKGNGAGGTISHVNGDGYEWKWMDFLRENCKSSDADHLWTSKQSKHLSMVKSSFLKGCLMVKSVRRKLSEGGKCSFTTGLPGGFIMPVCAMNASGSIWKSVGLTNSVFRGYLCRHWKYTKCWAPPHRFWSSRSGVGLRICINKLPDDTKAASSRPTPERHCFRLSSERLLLGCASEGN